MNLFIYQAKKFCSEIGLDDPAAIDPGAELVEEVVEAELGTDVEDEIGMGDPSPEQVLEERGERPQIPGVSPALGGVCAGLDSRAW